MDKGRVGASWLLVAATRGQKVYWKTQWGKEMRGERAIGMFYRKCFVEPKKRVGEGRE